MSEYRIRESNINCQIGQDRWRMERRFLAERHTKLLWIIPIWLPTMNSKWRKTAQEAQFDIDNDVELRRPCRAMPAAPDSSLPRWHRPPPLTPTKPPSYGSVVKSHPDVPFRSVRGKVQ